MTQIDPPKTNEGVLAVRALPPSNEFSDGIEPIGAIDSPTSLDEYRVVLREGTQAMHLQQALVTIGAETTTIDGRSRDISCSARFGTSSCATTIMSSRS
jgi:hypothetical protein